MRRGKGGRAGTQQTILRIVFTSGVFGSVGDFPTQNFTALLQEHLNALNLRIYSICWGSRRPMVASMESLSKGLRLSIGNQTPS